MITIIDYGLGNLGSVKNTLDKLGVNSIVSSRLSDIEKADGLILPGVGAAGEGMKNIRDRKLDVVIAREVKKGKPLLGICLGMQLMAIEFARNVAYIKDANSTPCNLSMYSVSSAL